VTACDCQPARMDRLLAASICVVAPVLTKPGHADQFKICEALQGISTSAMEAFCFDEEFYQWVTGVHVDHIYDHQMRYVGIFYNLRNKLPDGVWENV
jgi:hypothetical protein